MAATGDTSAMGFYSELCSERSRTDQGPRKETASRTGHAVSIAICLVLLVSFDQAIIFALAISATLIVSGQMMTAYARKVPSHRAAAR
jgi:hypothetical protein